MDGNGETAQEEQRVVPYEQPSQLPKNVEFHESEGVEVPGEVDLQESENAVNDGHLQSDLSPVTAEPEVDGSGETRNVDDAADVNGNSLEDREKSEKACEEGFTATENDSRDEETETKMNTTSDTTQEEKPEEEIEAKMNTAIDIIQEENPEEETQTKMNKSMDTIQEEKPEAETETKMDKSMDTIQEEKPKEETEAEMDASTDTIQKENPKLRTETKMNTTMDIIQEEKPEEETETKMNTTMDIIQEEKPEEETETKMDTIQVEKPEEQTETKMDTSMDTIQVEKPEEQTETKMDTSMDTVQEEKPEDKLEETEAGVTNAGTELGVSTEAEVKQENDTELMKEPDTKSKCFLLDPTDVTGNEFGSEEEQDAFMKELETFHRERFLDFKPPKFYQEPLNCLKLWRAVIRLGGYERVTSLKLWRQVGESFHPPKTCTTVSWTFRGFYEKALLEYEKHKMRSGELPFSDAYLLDLTSGTQVNLVHAPGSGRVRRDAAARAMQGWHAQRRLSNGEVGDPIIKDQNQTMVPKREKQLKNIGFMKRKGSCLVEQASKCARVVSKPPSEMMVVDVGMSADWVKVNVQRMKDCYEVYALIPGLLREEVHVQTDPAGRLVISGQPEQQDNPWGVTPFRKVVSLPTRIDPHHTAAVVTLHGQLFVRVPVED